MVTFQCAEKANKLFVKKIAVFLFIFQSTCI